MKPGLPKDKFRSMSKETVFVTGVSGFLGRFIAREFAGKGYSVTGLIRKPNNYDALGSQPIQLVTGDICDPEIVKSCVGTANIVVHAAALSAFNARDVNEFYRVNVEGTHNLLNAVKCSPSVNTFIYVSSRGTLGIMHPSENADESSPRPDVSKFDHYMKSKFLAETAVLAELKNSKIRHLIISPTAMIGTNDVQPSPVGKIIKDLIESKTRFFIDGGVNFVDVEDVARAIVLAVENGTSGETYILGNKNMELQELFQIAHQHYKVPLPKYKIPYLVAYALSFLIAFFGKILNRKSAITPRKVYTYHHKLSYCSSTKAQHDLGVTLTPFDETIRKTVTWFQSGGGR